MDGMKLTAKVKLLPTPQQADALKRTLEVVNAACNYASDQAWQTGTFRQFPLHQLAYRKIRDCFPLSAQVVVRLIAKVANAYKLHQHTKHTFKPYGAISYDSRILSWYMTKSEVSIWTVDGRMRMPFVCGPRQRELLQGQRGESDLCLIDSEFYLFVACDWEEPTTADVSDFLGVDLGIRNIAADSDGNLYSGAHLNGLRHRHRRLRTRLQKKGTRGALRLLRKRKRKERRFATWVNHNVSRSIVAKAKGTARGIALEDLQGIRQRVTARRPQRATLHSWAFHQLRSFISYKAQLAGVPVVLVDPHNTSRSCPACGYIDPRNRISQSHFSCVSCGLAGPADTIAAVNIGRRAAVNRPNCPPPPQGGAGQSPRL